jgi:hypothetical protein
MVKELAVVEGEREVCYKIGSIDDRRATGPEFVLLQGMNWSKVERKKLEQQLYRAERLRPSLRLRS